MTDYTELVKALRNCERANNGGQGSCYGCRYNTEASCKWKMMTDAASTIEKLQAEQKKTVTQIFGEEQMAWEERCVGLMLQISEQKTYDIRQLPEGLYCLKNGVVYAARMKLSGGNVYNVKTGESHWEDDRIVGGEQVLPKPEPPKEEV